MKALFILVIGAVLVGASSARAVISISERLQDCFEVRSPALVLKFWQNQTCQVDQSCEPFDNSVYSDLPVITCAEEMALICAIRPKENRTECLQEGIQFLEVQESTIDVAKLKSSLTERAEKETHQLFNPAEAMIVDLEGLAEIDCPLELARAFPFNQFSSEEFCSIYERIIVLSTLRRVEASVERWQSQ